MTIGITGPERRAPGRNAVVGIIIAAIVVGIFLILLGLTGDVLVDWLWFSSIGYLQVFLTTFGTKAAVFFGGFGPTRRTLGATRRLPQTEVKNPHRFSAGVTS